MDGLKAFNHLCEVIPQWNERLKALAYNVNERHLEFTRLSRTASGAASLHRKRTGSTESLRPDDETPPPDASPDRSGFPMQSTRVEINPAAKRLFQEYRSQAKRKRVSGSIVTNSSGAPRSRMSIIVYYDSAIQESFEVMVRSIAGARNTLRKGKTSASMKSRMSGMAMEESPFEGSVYNAEAFDQVDRELETAQTLCEIGAHQFLRDGNCQNEISGAHERIEGILAIAREQRTLYEQEAKVDAELHGPKSASEYGLPQTTLSPDKTPYSGIPAVDISMGDLLAVDESYNVSNLPAVDPTVAIDRGAAMDSGISVDPSLAVDSVAVDRNPAFDSIGVDSSVAVDSGDTADPSITVDSAILIDPTYTDDLSIAVDPKVADDALTSQDGCIAVDHGIEIDHEEPTEHGGIQVDSDPIQVATSDSKDAAYPFSTGPIEVDEQDNDSFHIDLTSFRRTRAM